MHALSQVPILTQPIVAKKYQTKNLGLHNFHLGKKCAVALIGRMQKFLPAILLALFL